MMWCHQSYKPYNHEHLKTILLSVFLDVLHKPHLSSIIHLTNLKKLHAHIKVKKYKIQFTYHCTYSQLFNHVYNVTLLCGNN